MLYNDINLCLTNCDSFQVIQNDESFMGKKETIQMNYFHNLNTNNCYHYYLVSFYY